MAVGAMLVMVSTFTTVAIDAAALVVLAGMVGVTISAVLGGVIKTKVK